MDTSPSNNINNRVIAIQKTDGINVGPKWWDDNVTKVVGNDSTEQQMFDTFMAAYDRDFPRGADGKRHPLPPPDAGPTA